MPSQTANEGTVQTGVDALLNLLKEKKKISLDEAAKKLNLPTSAVQTWVDFLVEERVVGVEYHFTKPFIYLNEDKDGGESGKTLEESRKKYFEELKKEGISEEQMEYFWKNKLLNEAKELKEHFMEEAKKKKMHNEVFLWEKFLNRLIS